ncbi:MAG: hypothetical protein ACK5RO_09010 [Pseudobdellovibrionaceae bacterium]
MSDKQPNPLTVRRILIFLQGFLGLVLLVLEILRLVIELTQ